MAIERVSNLEFTMWTELRAAITQIIASGTYQRLVRIHADMKQDADGFQYTRHRMHAMLSGPLGYRRFLPWHRAFLLIFERELRAINPNLSLPYWIGMLMGEEWLVFKSYGNCNPSYCGYTHR